MNLRNINQIKDDGLVVFMPSGTQATLFREDENIIVEYPELYRDKYTKEQFEKLMEEGIFIFEEPSQKIMEGFENVERAEGSVFKAQQEKPKEYVTPQFKNELLTQLDKLAKEHPQVKVRQQAITYMDELGLQEYWDVKAVKDFCKKNMEILNVKANESLIEEVGMLAGNDNLVAIGEQIESGTKAGFEPNEFGNWLLHTSLDTKWELLTPKMKLFILEKIAMPVMDGHISYDDLEVYISDVSTLTENDIKSLDVFTQEEMEAMLSGKEERLLVSYEVQFDGTIENYKEAFKLKKKKNKKKKLDELNKKDIVMRKTTKTMKEAYKVYNSIDPEAGFVCLSNSEELDDYLNKTWGEYRASLIKDNADYGTEEDRLDFLSNFAIEIVGDETTDCTDLVPVDVEVEECETCENEPCEELCDECEPKEIDEDFEDEEELPSEYEFIEKIAFEILDSTEDGYMPQAVLAKKLFDKIVNEMGIEVDEDKIQQVARSFDGPRVEEVDEDFEDEHIGKSEEEPVEEPKEVVETPEEAKKVLGKVEDAVDSLEDFIKTLLDADVEDEEEPETLEEMCMQKLPELPIKDKWYKVEGYPLSLKYTGNNDNEDKLIFTKANGTEVHLDKECSFELSEAFSDNMLTNINDLDFPDALHDAVDTKEDGTLLRLSDVMDAVKALQAQVAQAINDIKTEIKTTMQDTKQDIQQDVNNVNTRVQDAQSAIKDLAVEDDELLDEEPVEEEPVEEEAPAEEEGGEEEMGESLNESEEVDNIIAKAVCKILKDAPMSMDTLMDKLSDAGFPKTDVMQKFVSNFIKYNNLSDKVISVTEELKAQMKQSLSTKFIRKGYMEDLAKVKGEIDKMAGEGKSADEIKDAITLLASDDQEESQAKEYAVTKLKESMTQQKGLLSKYVTRQATY